MFLISYIYHFHTPFGAIYNGLFHVYSQKRHWWIAEEYLIKIAQYYPYINWEMFGMQQSIF